MRVNTSRVIAAFREGKRAQFCASIWTNGSEIYSYRTRMAWRENGILHLNTVRYSVTTTIHQGGLNTAFPYAVRVNGENTQQGRTNDELDVKNAQLAQQRREERKAAKQAARKNLRKRFAEVQKAEGDLSEARANLELARSHALATLKRLETLYGRMSKFM